jgi:hypothetical protein
MFKGWRKREWVSMAITTATAFALLMLATGCDNATSGRVVNKAYEEPYTYWDTQCGMYMTINGVMQCALYVTNPVAIPECWRLGFHNDADDEDGSVCLPKNQWDEYEEGSHYGTETPK